MTDTNSNTCGDNKHKVHAYKNMYEKKVCNVEDNEPITSVKIKEEIIEVDFDEPSSAIDVIDLAKIKEEEIDEIESTGPPVAFKINIEVEEYTEDKKTNFHNSLNDEPQVAKSSAKLKAPAKASKSKEPIKVVRIDLDRMYAEADRIAQNSDNVADAVLAIELKNVWGSVLKIPSEDDPRDVKIQEALVKWRSWHSTSKYRDVPLFYKCYICEKSWWHLDPFRIHLLCHDPDSYRIETEDTPHECHVMAYGTVNVPTAKDFYTEGECWKCNKPFEDHSAAKRQNGFYFCKCCEEKFHTCTDLKSHEATCWQYLKYLELDKWTKMLSCNLCKTMFVSKIDMAKHMTSRHLVRSDVPMPPQYRICTKCNNKYYIYSLHYCPKKSKNYDCKLCSRSFLSNLLLDLHKSATETDVNCKMCDATLLKKCMELLHYKKHTDNFIFAYKCSYCPNMEVYLDMKVAGDHRWLVHKKKSDKRRLFFEKIIIPRSYVGVETEVRVETVTVQPCWATFNNIENEDNHLQVNKTAVQKTYEKKTCPQKVANQLKDLMAVTQIKEETISEQDLITKVVCGTSRHDPYQLVQQPPYIIHTEVKSEPLDEEYEEDIIRLSMDHLTGSVEVKEEPVEIVIKTEHEDQEYEEDFTIKEEYIEEDLDECDDRLTMEPEVIVSMGLKMPPRIYTCNKCGYQNVHRKYKEHIMAQCQPKPHNKDNKKERFPCPKCRKNATSFKKYLLHFSKHGYPYMSCPVCLKPFENMTKLMPHVMMHVKQSFVKVYVIDRSQGNKTKRRDSKYQCRHCKGKVDYDNFAGHWVTHSNVWSKKFGKEMMDQKITEKGVENVRLEGEGLKLVIAYLQTDSSELKIKDCVLCERHFDRKNDCKRHLIEHLLTDAFLNMQKYGGLSCQICREVCSKPDKYKLHMRDHGSLPVYRCDICVRTFSDSSNFTKHKKVHNIQVLVCDICTKKFQAKSSLIKHMEIHSVTKPINCELCDKVYYTESSYRKHKRLYHEKSVTKFKCCICRQRFITLKEKWDHLWLVHKQRKMEADCPICKKGFRKMRDVNAHIKEAHLEAKIPKIRILNANPVKIGEMETLIIYE